MKKNEIELMNLTEKAVDNILGWLSNHATFVACEPTYNPYKYNLLTGEYQDADQDEEAIAQLKDENTEPCQWFVEYVGLTSYEGEINGSPEDGIIGGLESRKTFILEFFKEVDDLQMLQELIQGERNGK